VKDWKLILKVILGSTLLVLAAIWGLAKMAGGGTALTIDQNTLLDGARLVKENGETKVTVVNFSDMECPACKRAHELTKSLDNTPGVKVIFRHFPLGIHQYSSITARAVETARLRGKGWEMIDLLFNKQEEWSSKPKIEEKLTEYAISLGIDGKTFSDDLNSASVAAAVQDDIKLGDSLKLSGTPTIFVNGEQVAADFVMDKVNELLKQNK